MLLVPRPCDALCGAGDEQGSEKLETADVESPGDGDEEEPVTGEEASTNPVPKASATKYRLN